MKKIFSIIAILSLVFTFTFANPALAGNAAKGAQVFSTTCAACHAGGKNLVNPAKSLSKADLEKYGMNSAAAIVAQVTKGKGAMPAFGKRLTNEQIADVASYVLESSAKNWGK